MAANAGVLCVVACSTTFTDPDCDFTCSQETVTPSVQSAATYTSGLSGTSPIVTTTALVWVPGL